LMKMTGIDMLHVPYKGGGPMLTDLIAGQMHVAVTSLPTVLPHRSEERRVLFRSC